MNLVSSKPVTLEEAKELIKKREKDGELGYEQQQALEYLDKFAKDKESPKVKELMKVGKMTPDVAVKLADIAPKKPETVRAILLKDNVDLSDAEVEEIVKLLS